MDDLRSKGLDTFKISTKISSFGVKTINNKEVVKILYSGDKASKSHLDNYNKRLRWAGKPPVDKNNQNFKDWQKNIKFIGKSEIQPLTPLEDYKLPKWLKPLLQKLE